MVREIMKEHGLPEDLVYLAMIESGFNPKAYSPAKKPADCSSSMRQAGDTDSKSTSG